MIKAPGKSTQYIGYDILTWLGVSCKFTHDINAYLAEKPQDIRFPLPEELVTDSPFIKVSPGLEHRIKCSVFEDTGTCKHGYKCRFLGGHSRVVSALDAPEGAQPSMELIVDQEKIEARRPFVGEWNVLPIEKLKAIRSRNVSGLLEPYVILDKRGFLQVPNTNYR